MKDLSQKLNRITQIKNAVVCMRLANLLSSKSFGISKDKIEALELIDDKIKMADVKVNPGELYFTFQGPSAERDFCVYMQRIDKVFSIDEINTLSTLMGYDVFEYQPGPIMKKGGPGGPNCKHKWVRFRGKFIISGNVPTDRQIDSLVNKSIFN